VDLVQQRRWDSRSRAPSREVRSLFHLYAALANDVAAESGVAEVVFDGQVVQLFKIGRLKWDGDGTY
jgi:hypothetical protein